MEKWELLTEKIGYNVSKNMKTLLQTKYILLYMYVYEDVGGYEARVTVVISG